MPKRKTGHKDLTNEPQHAFISLPLTIAKEPKKSKMAGMIAAGHLVVICYDYFFHFSFFECGECFASVCQ